MSELSQADRFLLESIRAGDAEAWGQLVDRYRGRLLAFARSRVRRSSDAEDLLQDAFVNFLRGLPRFRGDAAIETYLFTILRRRIADWYRGRHLSVCLLHDVQRGGDSDAGEPAADLPAPDPTASAYLRADERTDRQRQALAEGIRRLVDGLKESLNFRDLKIAEMLFYGQLGNREVAGLAGLDERQIAVIKHRSLKKICQAVAGHLGRNERGSSDDDASPEAASLLTEVWETTRPSCPKRSTIGAFLLGTLEPGWHDYVEFHLHRLGCRFCLANLEDLQRQTADASGVRQRILESTVGFLSRRPHSAGAE